MVRNTSWSQWRHRLQKLRDKKSITSFAFYLVITLVCISYVGLVIVFNVIQESEASGLVEIGPDPMADPYVAGVFIVDGEYVWDVIDPTKVKIVELRDGLSATEILTELINTFTVYPYNPTQPYPYLYDLSTRGANCQAASIWLKTQLDYYGIENSLYTTDGKDHMYNKVIIGDQIISVDLARKEITHGQSL